MALASGDVQLGRDSNGMACNQDSTGYGGLAADNGGELHQSQGKSKESTLILGALASYRLSLRISYKGVL